MDVVGVIGMARSSRLRRRVMNILDSRTNRQGISARSAVAAAAVALAAVVPLSCVRLAQQGTAAAPAIKAPPPQTSSTAVAMQPTPRPVESPDTESAALGTPLPTRTVRVLVLDNASGKPIEGANVEFANLTKVDKFKTNTRGEVDLELHNGLDPVIDIWLSHYINKRVRWRVESGDPPPTEYTIGLDPVSSIGGKVLDDAGKPIAGANVEIYVNGTMENVGSFYVAGPWTNRAVVTEADGTWHFDRTPPHAESIKVAAWDYQHLDGDYFFLKPFTPVSALRDKTAVLTLPRGVAVSGTVVDPFSGRPIPNATLAFGADQSASNKIPPLTTRGDGTFSLSVRPGTRLFLTATAARYRPEVHEEVVGDKPVSIEFDLSPLHFVGE